jgi:hypothetical protein
VTVVTAQRQLTTKTSPCFSPQRKGGAGRHKARGNDPFSLDASRVPEGIGLLSRMRRRLHNVGQP